MSFIDFHRTQETIERATPAFVRGFQYPNNNTMDYTVTCPAQAVQGNLMVIQITSFGWRGFNVQPAGFTRVDRYNSVPEGMMVLFYKIAGPSEPLVIPISFLVGALNGGCCYTEWSNIDPRVPYVTSGAMRNPTSQLSHVIPAYNVLRQKALILQEIVFNVNTTTWVVDTGITAFNLTFAGVQKVGYKIFSAFDQSTIVTTWSSATDSRPGLGGWTMFNGKPTGYY